MEKGIGSGLAPRLNVAIVVARIFFKVKYRVIAEKFGVEKSKAKDIVIEAKERASSVDPMAILACAGLKDVSSTSKKLGPVAWSISRKADLDDVKQARDNFFDELQHVRFQLKRDNNWVDEEFGAEEATLMANLFFSDMLGPRALQNVQDYIKGYTTDYRDGVDKGAATRAAAEAKVTTYPMEIRRFFGVFAHAQVTKSEPQSLLSNLHKIEAYVRLLGRYDSLRALAVQKVKKLVRFLRMQKYRTRANATLRSCVQDFIAKSMGITKAVLTKTGQTAEVVIALTSRFGPGVLLLLPKNGMGKLNKWGKQRMAEVLPLLERHADFIKPVCKLLEKSIYEPIQACQALQISQISASSVRKLLRGDITFRAAIKRAMKDWKSNQENDKDTDVQEASEEEVAPMKHSIAETKLLYQAKCAPAPWRIQGTRKRATETQLQTDEALDTGDEEVVEGVAYTCFSEDSEDLDDSENSEDSEDLDDSEDEDDMEDLEHFVSTSAS